MRILDQVKLLLVYNFPHLPCDLLSILRLMLCFICLPFVLFLFIKFLNLVCDNSFEVHTIPHLIINFVLNG